MLSFLSDHPMLCALALILIDIVVWRLFSASPGIGYLFFVRIGYLCEAVG